jgi:hypothetical protein|tara:strand:- start:273 stop:794 length:522 start_codon:yes stop_codon:yes gene_type:complete
MARLAPGLTQEMYTGHGDSLLDWTPPDVNWMAPPRSPLIIDPSYRLVSDKGGLPSILRPKTGEDDTRDLPDAGHSWVYPIYHWGNPYQGGENTEENARYLPTDVDPGDGWTPQVWPTYTTNPDLYPHYSSLLDPFDYREDEEGRGLQQILVGRTQMPTSEIPEDVDWFNLQQF